MTESPPRIVEEVSSSASSVSDQLEDLQEFRTTVDEYRKRVENMEANERNAFYQRASSIRSTASNATTVEDLLSLEDQVEEAIRAPLQQVAVESLEELLDVIQPNLSDNVRQETFERLKSKIPSDLETAATAYQELYSTVEDFPANLQDTLAEVIEQNPSLLQNPERELQPTVQDLESRYKKLSDLEDIFANAGEWVPSFDLTTVDRFYSDMSTSIDLEGIKEKLEEIDEALRLLVDDDIHADDIAADGLKTWSEASDLNDLMGVLRNTLKDASSAKERYQTISDSIADIKSFGTDNEIFEGELDELQSAYNQLAINAYSSFEELVGSLEDLNSEIDSFIGQVHKRLKAQQNLVDQFDPEDDDLKPTIDLVPDGSPLLRLHVDENLTQALHDCKEHYDWITAHLEADSNSVDQDEMLSIWQQLSEGEQVQLTEDNRDAIFALADRLSLGVVLGDT